MIYFTADLHFDHESIIEYDSRPFSSVEEMNECLIELWNKVVTKKDTVYLLGNLCWSGPKRVIELVGRLNGHIHLIKGNHDRLNKEAEALFVTVSWQKTIRFEGSKYILSHYPFRTWAGNDKGVVNIHGHCHGNLECLKGAIDVGCCIHNYSPISIDELDHILMKTKK